MSMSLSRLKEKYSLSDNNVKDIKSRRRANRAKRNKEKRSCERSLGYRFGLTKW